MNIILAEVCQFHNNISIRFGKVFVWNNNKKLVVFHKSLLEILPFKSVQPYLCKKYSLKLPNNLYSFLFKIDLNDNALKFIRLLAVELEAKLLLEKI